MNSKSCSSSGGRFLKDAPLYQTSGCGSRGRSGFSQVGREDKIEILNGANNFGALNVSQDGSTAVVKFNKTTIRLENIDSGDLSASDFIF